MTVRGQVPPKELPAVCRGADGFVLPSRGEGAPRTIMAAMATGVSVVSNGLPQVRGLVSEGGYTVPIGEHEALAERLGGVWTATIRAGDASGSSRCIRGYGAPDDDGVDRN